MDYIEFFSKKITVQFIKFSLIGVANTIVHLSIYYLLLWFNVYYLFAYIIAFIFSVLNSYFWNKKFTFPGTTTTIFTFFRLYLSYGITTLLGIGILYFFVEIIGLNKYISPIINICISTAVNFILNKYFVFMSLG